MLLWKCLHHRNGLCLLAEPEQYLSVQHYQKYATSDSVATFVVIFFLLRSRSTWLPSSGGLFNMMALYGAFASLPQGFRLVKIHIDETNDQLWEGNWIVGYQSSIFLQSINLHWALKNEVPLLLHLSVWFCFIPFFTHLVSNLFDTHLVITPWHVMNVTVDPVGKPCDVLIEVSLWYCHGSYEDVERYKHCEGILWPSAWEYCVLWCLWISFKSFIFQDCLF